MKKKRKAANLISALALAAMILAWVSGAEAGKTVAFTGTAPDAPKSPIIQSLSGSYVVFDSSAGGDTCFTPGATQTFCFNAYSSSPDWEYVYNVWLRFPTDWVVTNVYVQGTPSCINGSWGAFSWAFQTPSYEVNITHARYQSNGGASCQAYYCFDVTSGTGSANALESWYWDGDGYGTAPHWPCSSDVYTPSGQNACDEMTQPQASIPPCYVAPGVYLTPPAQTGSGCNSVSATYDLKLFNNTGDNGTFTITYSVPSLNGTLTGPAQLFVPKGATKGFQAELTPDLCAVAGDNVTGVISVAGNSYTDTASIAHTVNFVQGWQAVSSSAPGWAGKGYLRDGCTAQNASGKWVTYLIGDTSGTGPVGFWGYNHDNNTWFNPGSANTPADRWAPDWAYDPATNRCYITGGATAPGGGNHAAAYVFDPVANSFTQLDNITSVRDFHNSWVGAIDGVKYLCIGGGVNKASAHIRATQCYDLSQAAPGAWESENGTMAAFPTDPFGAADGVLHAAGGDQFWYVGGLISSGVTDEARYWDDSDNAWHSAGNTGVPRYRVEGDFFKGDFYQVGGSSGGFTFTPSVVRGHDNGTAWVWESLPDMNNARMDNVVGVTTDSIWSIDGYGSTASSYVEYPIFCPECPCIDNDGDGYGDSCPLGPDCDDNNSAIHAPVTYYQDADGDGYRAADNPSEFCSLTPPAGYLDNSSSIDVDDTDPFYTDILPTCQVKIIPKTLGWLIGDKEKNRSLIVIGKRGTEFGDNPIVKWESDAIEVVSMHVFFKRFMFMRATFNGEPLDKQEYRVLVGECEGKIKWAK